MAVTEEKAQQEPSMEEILASIRRIISADGDDDTEAEAANGAEAADAAESEPERAEADDDTDEAEAAAETEDDVLELTDQIPAEPEPEPDLEPEAEPEPDPEPEAFDDRPSAGPLISPATAAASVTSLGELEQALAGIGARKEFGARTVEGLAVDLLRPMLREWLDRNLPGLVETLVRAEIERLAGQIKR